MRRLARPPQWRRRRPQHEAPLGPDADPRLKHTNHGRCGCRLVDGIASRAIRAQLCTF
jgi:hypothetical protein